MLVLILGMVLRFIYTLFIGILLALFIGLGISAFYEKPKEPEYPNSIKYARPIEPAVSPDSTYSAKMLKEQEEYDKRWKDYNKIQETYNRNVSIIALTSAIVVLIISLTLVHNLLLISDGLLLGGVFTLLYSVGRSFQTQDTKFEFIVVSIGLVIALLLGYKKFIQPTTNLKKKR
jgi:hypothetical protein